MSKIKALAFDVFGTVVDWKGTIVSEGRRLAGEDAPHVPWEDFASDWMRAYGKALASMTEWTNLDVMLEAAYATIAKYYHLDLEPAKAVELSRVWTRLRAWPDAASGFELLHGAYSLKALTNANTTMLASLARSSGLPWDELLSAETVRRYKPDPAIYQMILDRTGYPADQIMLVAAHCFDLNAAHEHGIRTALITRKGEPGSDPKGLDHEADCVVPDITVLAQRLIMERRHAG